MSLTLDVPTWSGPLRPRDGIVTESASGAVRVRDGARITIRVTP